MLTAACSGITAEVRRGGVELVEELAAEWRQLCLEIPNDEPFYRPEWIAAYLRSFAPAGRVVLVTARSHGELKAVLPLLEESGWFCGMPVRKLRGAADVHSSRFDLVCTAGPQGKAAAQAVWNALRELPGWDLIELPDVPEGGSAERLLEVARQGGFPVGRWETDCSPYIVFAGTQDAASIPSRSHFRRNLRRRWKKADAQGALRLHRVDRADASTLASFYDLENAGWKGEQKTAITCDAQTRLFYDSIAAAGEQFGYLSLYLLTSADVVIAGHFGLTYNGRYYSPKVAYDERYANYGPGHLIVYAILQDCIARGVDEFQFLGPWMDWKAEWTQRGQQHANCYVFRRGWYGRVLHVAKFKLMTQFRKLARHPRIDSVRKRSR